MDDALCALDAYISIFYSVVLACRVGDITLEDFKIATKKDGNYRYIFKALDPELGTVKEEVSCTWALLR